LRRQTLLARDVVQITQAAEHSLREGGCEVMIPPQGVPTLARAGPGL